jgi:hypothetical protein
MIYKGNCAKYIKKRGLRNRDIKASRQQKTNVLCIRKTELNKILDLKKKKRKEIQT